MFVTSERDDYERGAAFYHGKFLSTQSALDAAQRELSAANAKLAEEEQLFHLRWNADIRAIKRWHEAGNPELLWPDHADLCVWLLEQLESANNEKDAEEDDAARLREQLAERDGLRAKHLKEK